jgi:diguanylate cyclase (GGDEF)-like protein
VARIGGDEFVVLNINASDTDRDRVAVRLCESLNVFNAQQQLPFALSVSVGTAMAESGGVTTVQDLLSVADESMYRDKRRKQESPWRL